MAVEVPLPVQALPALSASLNAPAIVLQSTEHITTSRDSCVPIASTKEVTQDTVLPSATAAQCRDSMNSSTDAAERTVQPTGVEATDQAKSEAATEQPSVNGTGTQVAVQPPETAAHEASTDPGKIELDNSQTDEKLKDDSDGDFSDFGRETYSGLLGTRSLSSSRKKKARLRLMQSATYAALVEDRIQALEAQLEDLKRTCGKATNEADRAKDDAGEEVQPQEPESEHVPAIEVARMGQQEWCENENMWGNCVVDLLIERPDLAGRKQSNWRRSRRRSRKDAAVNSLEKKENEKEKSKVWRIRINSQPLCDVIEEVLGKDVAPTRWAHILPPFKSLLAYQTELKDKCEDLKETIAEKSSAGSSDAGVDNKPVEDASVPSKTEEADSENENAVQAEVTTETPSEDVPSDGEVDQLQLKLDHLQCLLTILEVDLKEDVEIHAKYSSPDRDLSERKIQFEHLWHLFAPGDLIYDAKKAQAYQVLCVHNGREILDFEPDYYGTDGEAPKPNMFSSSEKAARTPFVIDYIGLGFNGEEFGPLHYHLSIDPFNGEKKITDLDLYPVEYGLARTSTKTYRSSETPTLSDSIPLGQALLERGRKYSKFANAKHAKHCAYRGMTLDITPELVDSHVIVDTSYYYETHADKIPTLGLDNAPAGSVREVRDPYACCDSKTCNFSLRILHDDRKVEEDRMNNFKDNNQFWLGDYNRTGASLTDNQLRLLPAVLWGFVLYSREWRCLDVNKIREVSGRKNSFEELQINSLYRRLVESQVTVHSSGVKPTSNFHTTDGAKPPDVMSIAGASGHTGQIPAANDIKSGSGQSNDGGFDDHREDLVRGKGKGLIILLHGAPGVGKTSTAECVAEYTKRPLLSITCGDIGDTAESVQTNLEFYLNLAHRWGCVMLLDEADVFLTARNKTDMQRNAVVSVFLRILEYYSGILFLTTNKVGTVDEAFKSRIHLSLYYGPLNEDQSIAIWHINMKRIQNNKPKIRFNENEVERWAFRQYQNNQRLGLQPWNGRQIRNACQTAAALAEFEHEGVVTIDHLEQVREASHNFDRYLRELHGGDDAWRAQKNKDRRDNYDQSWQQRETVQYGHAAGGPNDIYNTRRGYSDERNNYQDDYYPPAMPRDDRRQPGFDERRSLNDRHLQRDDTAWDSDNRTGDPRSRPANLGAQRDYDETQDRRRMYDADSSTMPPPPSRPNAARSENEYDTRDRVDSRSNGRVESRGRGGDRDRYR